MQRQVSAFDAKTHLSELLREAERGWTIVITRHGKPVARLTPVDQVGGPAAGELAASFRSIRNTAGKRVRLRDLIEEGRKH